MSFQMIIFLLKREFMLIGWMVVYILSYVAAADLVPSLTVMQIPYLWLLFTNLFVLVYGRVLVG